jgi:hypothetical protein
MKRFKTLQRTLALTTAACLFCFTIALAKKPQDPGGGGGGGGGGEDTLRNPAIVFVQDDTSIVIASADGQVKQKILSASKRSPLQRHSPVWTPDGTEIIFLERDTSTQPSTNSLYIMNADGSGLTFVRQLNNLIERSLGIAYLPGGGGVHSLYGLDRAANPRSDRWFDSKSGIKPGA